MSGQLAIDRLTFARAPLGHFQVGPGALAAMRRYVQDDALKPESGGVLLGRHLLGTRDIIVDCVTTPLPGDRGTRTRFFRARARHQTAIDRAWRESGGTCTYLGEWHTHPEPIPTPSRVDLLGWRRKLRVDRFAGQLFFVIVGTTEIVAWEGARDHTTVDSLIIEE